MKTELERKFIRLIFLEWAITTNQFPDEVVVGYEEERQILYDSLIETKEVQEYLEYATKK